jgi:hypothetical protein
VQLGTPPVNQQRLGDADDVRGLAFAHGNSNICTSDSRSSIAATTSQR